jgi:hippurate hydrolase
MHACGHDLHVAVELATAWALSKNRDLWKGTLVMITQPAEEVLEGAAAMIKDGLFERFPKPQNIVAFHTSGQRLAGTVAFATGPAYAADDVFDITFHGKGVHGSTPQLGVDPIPMMAEFVEKIHTLVAEEVDARDVAVITVGLAQAGSKGNIIPDTAHVQGTIRTYSPEARALLKQRVAEVAKAISTGARGGPPDVNFIGATDPVINDPALTERLLPALQSAAIDGKAEQVAGATSSEDFAAYGPAAKVPEVIFWVGVQHSLTPPVFGNHTSKFAPDFRPSFTAAARAMTQSVLTLLPAQAAATFAQG